MPSLATGKSIKSLSVYLLIFSRLSIAPKCYWLCIREFLPQSVRKNLEVEWNTHTDRGLSLAWLRNALNQQSLHFQMLAFVAQPDMIARYYERNACIRNIPLLKRVTVGIGDLNEVEFRIEVTFN